MAVFEYTALNSSGRRIRGLVDADTERSARQKLKGQGIFPTSIEETRQRELTKKPGNAINLDWLTNRRVTTGQLAMATRQLSTLVGSGMPLVESLRALSELVEHPTLKRVIAEITDRVNEGSDLAEALKHYPKVFSRLYTNMIAAGQANGRLDLVMERLADLLEAQEALMRKVVSAITYPILMLLLCAGVIVILLAYVVPQITAIFASQGQILPLPTRVVIALSDFLQQYWLLLIGGFVTICLGLSRYIQTTAGRNRLDKLKLNVPIAGNLNLKIATSRFARNLGTLISSDVPLLDALQIVKNIVGNVHLERATENAIEGVREGRSLSRELAKAQLFPSMLIHMTAAGEQSGEKLAHMLVRAASSYESEVNAVVSALTSILEPILIVVLAAIVGGILAAVMLPMLEMNNLAVG